VPEVQPADPVARRRAITLVVFATLAGAVLIGLIPDLPRRIAVWLVDDAAAGPAPNAGRLIGAVGLFVTLPIVGVAVLMWRMGRRTVVALRFPPPGARMPQDTPILTGEAAGRRGRLLQGLAVILAGMAAVMTVLIWMMVGRFGAS
jgi:hypothetical protein